MGHYTTQVGMDVHARSISCRAMEVATGEVWAKAVSGEGMEAELLSWLARLPQPVRRAYESGCTGFALARLLRGAGVACDVVAVSTLPRSPRDRRRKNDRHDAAALLREMRNPASDMSLVWVPPAEAEGARDLARAAARASQEARAAKQRCSMPLLRHGFARNERTATGRPRKAWGAECRRWARSLDMGDPLSNAARDAGLLLVERAERGAAELARAVAEEAEGPRWRPYVDALSRIKGVDVRTAFLAAAGFGEFPRFPSGRRASRWVGCTPSEDSGGGRRRQGAITKEGSACLRRALAEGMSSISRHGPGPKRARPGHGASPAVEETAANANARLAAKYRRLTGAGRRANTAKLAVVSELARWIWAIGLRVERELASA